MFIVLEGIDKCGKGTQSEKVINFLKQEKGLDVWGTHEPTYKGVVGRVINFILKKKIKLSPLFFQRLFVLDRWLHLFEIKKQLKKGKTVVCDRYFYTTIAFCHADKLPVPKVIRWHEKMLKPDILFFIDIKGEEAMARIKKEKSNPEWFERCDFLTRAREGYLEHINCFREVKVFRIDGRPSPEEVFLSIKQNLEKFL